MPHQKLAVSRRKLLTGAAKGVAVVIGLPPLEAMFNPNGTLYAEPLPAAASRLPEAGTPPEPRFVIWFNGNVIIWRCWISEATGPDYEMMPCIAPLAPFRHDIHGISGLDKPAAR